MSDEEIPPEVRAYFSRRLSKIAASGGEARAQKLSAAARKRIAKKAGQAAAEAMSPEQRKERARKAALAMHAKKRAAAKRKSEG
jgi:hypothetical protein